MRFSRSFIVVCIVGATAATMLASSLVSVSPILPWSSGAPASGPVAVRVGGRSVSVSDVDERWKRDRPAEYLAAVQALYDGRRKALETVVGEVLVEGAATSRGMTADAFVATETARRIQSVDDNDVLAFYAANADQLEGVSLDLYRDRIKEALEERARRYAYNELVEELATAPGQTVSILLDPPRQETPISDQDPSLGESGAPVTIVTFSDFQCPFCARVEPTLKDIQRRYGDKVRIVWKDFPLTTIHPEAFKAAEAGHCAAEQQRYWQFHDRLFADQQQMSVEALKAHAAALGLDRAAFATCLESGRYEERVRENLEAGRRLGVEATPTLFINGRTVSGAQPVEVLAGIINEELYRAGVSR